MKKRLKSRWRQIGLEIDFHIYYSKYKKNIEFTNIVAQRKIAKAIEINNSNQITNKKKKSNIEINIITMQLCKETNTRDSMRSLFDTRLNTLIKKHKC